MFRTITIITLLSTATLGASQSFAPLGAQWTYNFHRFVNDYPLDCEYDPCSLDWRTLRVTAIDTIDSKPVSVLSYEEIGGGTIDASPIKFYQEGDSIFYYFRDSFRLLYNFAALPGDTIELEVPTFHFGAGPISYTDESQDSIVTGEYIVEDLGTINIQGEERDVRTYASINNSLYIMDVVEGIGSIRNLFGTSNFIVATGCGGAFWCYADNETIYAPAGCCEVPQDYPERTIAPVGAEWLFEGWSNGTALPNCESVCEGNYNLFRVVGEEVLAGRNYAKIQRFTRTINTSWEATEDFTYLYDQDGIVYAKPSWNVPQLFDFTLEEGDTMNFYIAREYSRFIGNDNWPLQMFGSNAQFVARDVSTIEIDGQMRKIIDYEWTSGLEGFRIGQVVEGIGPLSFGLLGSDIPIPTAGCEPRLICYRDSLITFTTDDDCGCEFPIGPNSIAETESLPIGIYPNPATDLLYLEYDTGMSIDGYTIYAITGEIIKRKQIETKLESIQIDDLTSGLYYLKFASGIESQMIKFVKE